MDKMYKIGGRLLNKDGKPLVGIKVKIYDDKGNLLTTAVSDDDGRIDTECDTAPKSVKAVYKEMIIGEDFIDFQKVKDKYEFGDHRLCDLPPADWHIVGIVTDKMSGNPLRGLIVEAFDEDPGNRKDYLGEDVTDVAGEFNIWFNEEDFDESKPDIFFKIKNEQNVEIHRTETDVGVSGEPHDCSDFYCTHKGKEYLIEIDHISAVINKVGPVTASDINDYGLASHREIDNRPFGGNITIIGRIWGAKVHKWRLSYAAGFVDSGDDRFNEIDLSRRDPFSTIASGTNKIWDGPIDIWNTRKDELLEGLHTVILIVWDEDGNEYHDTQILYVHNTMITPPAQILAPSSCVNLSKTDGTTIEIRGTASDDYFNYYKLQWAGCSQTELVDRGITYPPAGYHTPVVNDILGYWDINGLGSGPYVLRLAVHDRTILHDGSDYINDWTWITVNIISG